MKTRVWAVLLLLAPLLITCQPEPSLVPTDVPTATPLPITSPAHKAAATFLDAWAEGDYQTMYALCSTEVREAVSYAEFLRVYEQVAEECTTLAVHPSVRAVLQEGTQARAVFSFEMETSFVGSFDVENELPLVWDHDRWAVDWSKQCIFGELEEDNLVHMFSQSVERANIYDVNGKGLAVKGELVTIGVVPAEIEDEAAVLSTLGTVLRIPQADIQAIYKDQPRNWFIPIADIPVQESQKHYESLSKEPGITLRPKSIRIYPKPVVAPHIIGYMSRIPAEELAEWQARGYSGDELAGRAGMEGWGETYLAGQRGGVLTIITPEGQVVTTLARREAIPARSVYLTIEHEFQRRVEELLGERRGAVVVMDVSDGRILALATWPRFDPNLFAEGLDPQAWSALVNDPNLPLMNRAIQGQYPPGSTFKIVTMGTVMERGGVKATQTYNCPGSWNKLGWNMTCWLKRGHGTIDLVNALTASCDVTFYQIGYDLSYIDIDALPSYARSFGLGAPTGIGKMDTGSGDPLGEASGLVPDDAWKRRTYDEGWATGDTVNLAIGQGFLLTTPVQMCRLVAAVANGGTVHRPQIVWKIGSAGDEPEQIFQPDRVGRLPITQPTLEAIRAGMEGATTSPRGTATHRFVGFPLTVAGKTGTAQNEGELPHAWFIGYLPADKPEIAIAVMIENVGEGSTYAAPIFRQVAGVYYGMEEEAPDVKGEGD